ncbi:MAG: InlB B-repeat-containing protein, partial [Paludibacteraceae bacterium]|nr:InlB B-repeat-containing protein [Paludibacteraceae bacterium]
MRKLLKSNAKGLKSYGGGASHFFLVLLMLLTLGSGNAWAEYWQLRVEAIYPNGEPAKSYVSADGCCSAPTPTSSVYTMPNPKSNMYSSNPDTYLWAEPMCGEVFDGWYEDKECTRRFYTSAKGNAWGDKMSFVSRDANAANVEITTIYAKFLSPNPNWLTLAQSPIIAGNRYYIYSLGLGGFVGLEEVSDGKILHCYKDPNKAVLFTLSDATNPEISCEDDGETKYVDKGCYLRSEATHRILSLQADGSYKINLNNGNTSGWIWGEVVIDAGTTYARIQNALSNESYKQRWIFIPEATYKSFWKVKSVKENGSVTINASPTASGTTYVKFNVSQVGPLDAFECVLTGNDGNWEMGTLTLADSVVTVPVTYTAYNIHSGTSAYISQATVTLTAKNTAATHASGTATAYVDLQPTFTMPVNALDWSTKPGGDEIYNVGMEVAASQRERLQNKLVYSTANAIAQNNATWTATIIGDEGDNPEQFKFKNGTRTVTFSPYSADSLDVIYAPTATTGEGTHNATLHVEVSYTDATSPTPQTLTCVGEVALSGKAQDVAMLTMALDGSEIASNDESRNFGDIIGTNSQTVTVDLYNHGLTNLTKTWVTSADGVFEFDADTIDLTRANQRLVIRAHRSTPITTEYEDYEATLTISGEDSNGDPMSAELTLNYRALPLIPTTVTWNWEHLYENMTHTDPLVTNSDGEWSLDQRDGNGGMTYHAETRSITTEYMHHESGYTATFELTIPQTDTYTARTDTFVATISAFKPKAIYINSAADFNEYVEGDSWVNYKSDNNSVHATLSTAYFKWSGQPTIMFEFDGVASTDRTITEIYSDASQKQIYNAPFSITKTNEIPISPQTTKLKISYSGDLLNVRYLEYDTIDVNYHGVVFVEGGAATRNITATFANKREVTVSLNAAVQPYFELRAEGKPTGSTLVYGESDGLGVYKTARNKVFTVAIKDGVNYAEAKAASVNGFQVILQDNYTYNSEVVVLPIALEESYQVTYKHDAHGSYKVTYHDDWEHPHTVSAADYVHTVSSIVETSCTATLSDPDPESGYMFRGWKVNGELVSCKDSFTVIPASGATVEPIFVLEEEAVYGLDSTVFANLDDALETAGSIAETKPVVVLLKDVTLSEPATHTIPAGVTLLIPYKANFKELQTTPEITTTAAPLAAYRTLTLKEGVNFVVNGNICVSAKILAAGGGNKSAYTTDECGVINMANGGHIELNNGAHLYCWGYIKGQDMDQGNNTVGTGTITVNAGAIVHENFELGDWRGGTASSNIYFEKDDKHLFPFQSYALQNVEIPTTYTYGSKLETFMVVNTGFGSVPFAVSMIGSQNTLFLLQDAGSVIRKWYDPTTDLCCYELSGTAQLDELVMNLPFVGDFASGTCNLPVSNSMHIILKDNLTLSKPLTVQAGAVVEIKPTATINLTAKVHLFDVDEWDLYIHNYYFRSFNNLTSHKDRGAENSKAGLEDAKFIIDGTLNVKNGQGYIYSTAGGANLMGNGGGKIVFEGALPTAGQLWQVTVLGQKPYITWVPTDEAAANLCNEDGSYTRSYGLETFHNVHGRWFREQDDEYLPQADHTYTFRYMINDNPTDDEAVAAVYSHDKTGLEARMKWFNVEAVDGCDNWWTDAAGRFYNYTKLGEWHQFIATDQANVYSGSDNVLYLKDGCTWTENAYIDENCLYTIGGVKKALVNGTFIPLTANGYDPAYHASGVTPEQYYICFTGCNWHPATKYAGESKAYTIHPEAEDLHYIWFNNDWLNVERDGAFFFTADEVTNVRTYYEYVNGDWMVAAPYVSVTDEAETRNFYMIKEAFNVAQIKKGATITLLRDLTNVSEVLSFSTQNTTCTLDLNGHVLSGDLENMITVDAPGCTFTITDNSTLKNGKISSTQSKAVYAKKGTVVLNNGTIESTGAYAIECASGGTIEIEGGYLAATTCIHVLGSCTINAGHFTDNTGLVTYCAANKYPFETEDSKYRYEVSDAWVITFVDETTTLQTLHVKPGETPQYTAAQPTKADNKFTGWSPAIAAASQDQTYTAQFAAISEGEVCVTLNSNGGNEGDQYVYVTSGSAIGTLPAGTTKNGHTFAGWFTENNGGTQITTETVVSGPVTWYAHYNKNSYTLAWDANGGQLSGSYTKDEVEFGAAITAPTVTKEG